MVNDPARYRGKRALVLTRVSTQAQGKNFSHAAQERKARTELVAALGMYIADEQRHIVHSNYTGLHYQYNEALDLILRMAEAGEFDVLCMDVLDRGLGRKTIARELYRMQLREFGVRTLTTDPNDHADDDSFEGQVMRLHKGLKAEEEVMDIVRRTSNGRREKALGNPEKGILPQVVGNGYRRYGYKFVKDEKGTRIGYELNLDVIYVDADGVEWTEVKVVIFVFESAARGTSLRQIAAILNEKGIPIPFVSRGIRRKGMKEEPIWQRSTLSKIVKYTGYYGEDHYGKTVQVRIPGRKRPIRKETPPEEHIIVPIPAIVTKKLWEKANRRVASNQQIATRNNKTTKDCLLRGGFAKCAYCGLTLTPRSQTYTVKSGEQPLRHTYKCPVPFLKNGKCPGCSIAVDILDAGVAEYIRDIIRDPSEVDQMIATLLKENPLSKQQQRKIKDLNKILGEQETMRANLAREMKKKTLSEQTVAFLGRDLADLERQEQEARKDLANQQQVQQQYEDLDRRIAEFHQRCTEMREQLEDPQFTPDFHFYQEAVIFFGINVKVWKSGTLPRYEIRTRPPEIVELLS